MDEKKLRLIKFGADYCGPCKAMARAKTLEKFAAKHTELELEVVDIEQNEERADQYDFRGIPAFVFEDCEGNILHSDEGATNEMGLERMLEKALKALDDGKFGKVRRKKRKKAPVKAAEEEEEDEEEDDEDEEEGDEAEA